MELLLNLTNEALYTVIGITGGAICALHFVSVLTKGISAKIAQYVNIFLHIILFCVLLLSDAKIDVAVTVFMASVFLYVLISFIKYEAEKRKRTARGGKETKNL